MPHVSTPTILIAGGGTGGHVFPGLAVAQALGALANVDVVFAGSPRGLETRVVPAHGYTLELVDVEPMKGGGVSRAVRGAFVAAKALRRASSIVRRYRPAAVLSVGGYAAGPIALACVLHRVPLAVLEPNRVLGFTNRLLAPFARRAYVAWDEMASAFRKNKTRVYGVPLRPGFEPRPLSGSRSEVRILVLGGSQGARALNERLPQAIARATRRSQTKPTRDVAVVHQAGRDREDAVREVYARAGLANVTVLSFVDDVAAQIAAADVVVARAGAGTVAEIAAIGRPAILVPFPHAADDHQAKNAMAAAERGGAWCIREEHANEERLAEALATLLDDEALRARMAQAAQEGGKPDAAYDVTRDLLALGGVARAVNRSAEGVRGARSNGAPSPESLSKEAV